MTATVWVVSVSLIAGLTLVFAADLTMKYSCDNVCDVVSIAGRTFADTDVHWAVVRTRSVEVYNGHHVIGVQARDFGVIAMFIASVSFNGVLLTQTGLPGWKVRATPPRTGWNTDFDHDETGWQPVSVNCTWPSWSSSRIMEQVSHSGSNASYVWSNTCRNTSQPIAYFRYEFTVTGFPEPLKPIPVTTTTIFLRNEIGEADHQSLSTDIFIYAGVGGALMFLGVMVIILRIRRKKMEASLDGYSKTATLSHTQLTSKTETRESHFYSL